MSKEALKLALEALETYHGYMEPLLTVFGGPRVPAEKSTTYKVEKAITAIKEALSSPNGEAQRKPLTDEQVREIANQYALSLAFPYDSPTTPEMFARAIEAAHGIKE